MDFQSIALPTELQRLDKKLIPFIEKKVNNYYQKTLHEGRNDQGKAKIAAFRGCGNGIIPSRLFCLELQIGDRDFFNAYKVIAQNQSLSVLMLQFNYAGTI